MAVASPCMQTAPEMSSKLMGALNLSITPEDCQEGGYGAWSFDKNSAQPASAQGPFSSAAYKAASDDTPYNVDLISDSSSSSTSSLKGKLPVVLEENESVSFREGLSIWDMPSSSSSLSIASSSESSTHALSHGGGKTIKARKTWKHHKKRGGDRRHKEASLMSLLLWPLKKLRDGYMSCMMALDGAGDLSGLAQGSSYGVSAKYFVSVPMSKTDAKNYG